MAAPNPPAAPVYIPLQRHVRDMLMDFLRWPYKSEILAQNVCDQPFCVQRRPDMIFCDRCFFDIDCRSGSLCAEWFRLDRHRDHVRLRIYLLTGAVCVREEDVLSRSGSDLPQSAVVAAFASARQKTVFYLRPRPQATSDPMIPCLGCHNNFKNERSPVLRQRNVTQAKVCSLQCLVTYDSQLCALPPAAPVNPPAAPVYYTQLRPHVRDILTVFLLWPYMSEITAENVCDQPYCVQRLPTLCDRWFFDVRCGSGSLCAEWFNSTSLHRTHSRLRIYSLSGAVCVREEDVRSELPQSAVVAAFASGPKSVFYLRNRPATTSDPMIPCLGCHNNFANELDPVLRQRNVTQAKVCSLKCLLMYDLLALPPPPPLLMPPP